MKRTIFSLAAIAVLALAACGGGGSSSPSTPTTAPSSSASASASPIPTGDPTTVADGMTLSTSAMSFDAVDTANTTTYAQTFTVTEPNSYTGTLSATSSNLSVAQVSPANGPVGTVFTVNPIGTGYQLPIITVTDSNNDQATIKITVTTTNGSIQ